MNHMNLVVAHNAALIPNIPKYSQVVASSFQPVVIDGEPRPRKITDEIIQRVYAPLEALPEDTINFPESRKLLTKSYRFLFHGELKLMESDAAATDKCSVVMDYVCGRSIDLHLEALSLLHTSSNEHELKDFWGVPSWVGWALGRIVFRWLKLAVDF